ncbi:hypothetical protein C0431_05565 [bacterium]|nr:hypothetical protein [bacterium]
MTRSETILWSIVRQWSRQGIRIRRQHPIPPYIVDFANIPSHLVIEIDGRSHAEREIQDQNRTQFLELHGWTVLRFDNEEVLKNLGQVASTIANHITNQGYLFTNNFDFELVPTSPDAQSQPRTRSGGMKRGDNFQSTSLTPSPDGEGKGWGDQPKEYQPRKITNPPSQGEGSRRERIQILSDLLTHPALEKIKLLTTITKFENQVYLVGGAIRDALLNLPQKNDFDLVTEQDAIELAELLHSADPDTISPPQIYPRFGTAMIHIAGVNIELITARRESYSPNSRKPSIRPATLADDALRRDFTINTLLLNLHTQKLLDPLGVALEDLQNHIIRTPLDPLQTFSDDPLRMLRAIRFKHHLGFIYPQTMVYPIGGHIPPTPLGESLPRTRSGGKAWGDKIQNTSPTPSPDGEGQGWRDTHSEYVSEKEHSIYDLASTIRAAAPRLAIISQERIRDEFTKILLGPNPDFALQDLLELGLLHTWASELEAMVGVEQGQWHYADVWTHTLHVVKNVSTISFPFTSVPPPSLGEDSGGGKTYSPKLEIHLAALLHDIAKPITKSTDSQGQIRFFNHENIGADLAYELCLRWRYSQDTATAVRLLVKNHMRLTGIKKLTLPATRRIIRDLGPQLDNWLILINADANALKSGVRHLDLSELKTKIQELKTQEPQSSYDSPLTGQEIMTIAKIPPGPEVGELKDHLANLVIEGKIPLNDKQKAKRALQTILRNRPKS